jgi:hypothetical protein
LLTEFSRPILDLFPDVLNDRGLGEVFAFADAKGAKGKNGKLLQGDLENTFKKYTPDNSQIVEDILDKGTYATKEEIEEAVKGVANFKKLRGKILANPFITALTNPPVSLTRLDAKFIAQMYRQKPGDTIEAKTFLNSVGAQMTMVPPEDELLKIKKAVVGNALDLKKLFGKYDNR